MLNKTILSLNFTKNAQKNKSLAMLFTGSSDIQSVLTF